MTFWFEIFFQEISDFMPMAPQPQQHPWEPRNEVHMMFYNMSLDSDILILDSYEILIRNLKSQKV